MDTPDLRHIVVTWDLDEGTGLAVRYGDMHPERASVLLALAAKIVAEHAALIDELEIEELEQDVEYELEGDEHDDDDEDDE
jgi:hypothetical protein